jgi:hypothetical protein
MVNPAQTVMIDKPKGKGYERFLDQEVYVLTNGISLSINYYSSSQYSILLEGILEEVQDDYIALRDMRCTNKVSTADNLKSDYAILPKENIIILYEKNSPKPTQTYQE